MKLSCDGNISSFVVSETLCGATAAVFDLLGLKNTVLDANYREPTTTATKMQLRAYCTLLR